MANRLPLETKAGNLDESVTFAQLTEHLRLGAEAAYLLGHQRKANGDELIGSGFLAIGELLERAVAQTTKLAMKGRKNPMTDDAKELLALADCPVGLFMKDDELCLKTEYGDNNGRIDAYIVSTGEFFWGGTSKPQDQRKVLVQPVEVDALHFSARQQASVEEVAHSLCKADGTAQCAAICLSHFSTSTTGGKCPEAARVWGHKCRALLAKYDIFEKVSRP